MNVMKLPKIFFLTYFVSINLLIIQSGFPAQGRKLLKASEISKDELLPQNGLCFKITFLDKTKPIAKGWWFLSRDKMRIEIFIKNELDSTIHIEPPYSIPGDQTLSFQISKEEKIFLPKNIPVIKDTVPLKFLKIEPGSAYKDTIDVLADDDYNFNNGEIYELSAIYNSQWGAFIDDNGQRHPVWSGRIQSNSLEFRYQE